MQHALLIYPHTNTYSNRTIMRMLMDTTMMAKATMTEMMTGTR